MTREEQIEQICVELAEGKSLRSICRENGWKESSIRYWLNKSEESFAQYAHARELQADVLFDEILEIADGKHESAKMDVQERRLQIDARKWMAGKLRGKYSDKLIVEGQQTVTHRYDLDSLETERLDELERILADAARGKSGAGETVPSQVH